MASTRERIKQLGARIDALTVKERALLLAATVLGLVYGWQVLVVEPMLQRQLQLTADIEAQTQRNADLDAQASAIAANAEQDPDADTRQTLAQLEQRCATLQAAFTSRTQRLIDPRQMAEVLKTVLERFSGLAFVSVESLGAEPLLPLAEGEGEGDGAIPGASAYRHGMRLRFEGSYLDTIAYLREIEASPYGFYWDALDYEVEDFPSGRGSVVVFTLSTTADWIGA